MLRGIIDMRGWIIGVLSDVPSLILQYPPLNVNTLSAHAGGYWHEGIAHMHSDDGTSSECM